MSCCRLEWRQRKGNLVIPRRNVRFRRILAEKIVEIPDPTDVQPSLDAVAGDPTLEQTDVIVNAANPELVAGGGGCGPICARAGPGLVEACAGSGNAGPDGGGGGDARYQLARRCRRRCSRKSTST